MALQTAQLASAVAPPVYVLATFMGDSAEDIIQDGPKSDYRTHAEDYQAETREVTNADTLRVKPAPGRGACMLGIPSASRPEPFNLPSSR